MDMCTGHHNITVEIALNTITVNQSHQRPMFQAFNIAQPLTYQPASGGTELIIFDEKEVKLSWGAMKY